MESAFPKKRVRVEYKMDSNLRFGICNVQRLKSICYFYAP